MRTLQYSTIFVILPTTIFGAAPPRFRLASPQPSIHRLFDSPKPSSFFSEQPTEFLRASKVEHVGLPAAVVEVSPPRIVRNPISSQSPDNVAAFVDQDLPWNRSGEPGELIPWEAPSREDSSWHDDIPDEASGEFAVSPLRARVRPLQLTPGRQFDKYSGKFIVVDVSEGDAVYRKDLDEAIRVINKARDSAKADHRRFAVGFDCEFVNSGVALIQIALPDFVVLVRTNSGTFPWYFKRLIQDASVLKIGVNTSAMDAHSLELLGIPIDQSSFYNVDVEILKHHSDPKCLLRHYGKSQLSLVDVCDWVLLKPKKERQGKWGAIRLNRDQERYAIEDAWFSLFAYAAIEQDQALLKPLQANLCRKSFGKRCMP